MPVQDSEEINRLLPSTLDHQLVTYDEQWQEVNHAFKPTGTADADSRLKTVNWFTKHLPPTGN